MVMFEGTPTDTEAPVEETPEVDTKKVDRVMKVFEALSPEEQQAAFDRMQEVVAPQEPEAPEGEAPMGEEPPMPEEGGGNPFSALQDRLKNI